MLIYMLKLELFINITPVYFAELLTDFSYTNITVSYRDALDRLRVHLNIILLGLNMILYDYKASSSNLAQPHEQKSLNHL